MEERKTGRKKQTEELSETMSVYYAHEKKFSSIRTPVGLTDKIDELLFFIYEKKGVKFSRNEFILKAISHYIDFCLEAKSQNELIDRVEKTSTH